MSANISGSSRNPAFANILCFCCRNKSSSSHGSWNRSIGRADCTDYNEDDLVTTGGGSSVAAAAAAGGATNTVDSSSGIRKSKGTKVRKRTRFMWKEFCVKKCCVCSSNGADAAKKKASLHQNNANAVHEGEHEAAADARDTLLPSPRGCAMEKPLISVSPPPKSTADTKPKANGHLVSSSLSSAPTAAAAAASSGQDPRNQRGGGGGGGEVTIEIEFSQRYFCTVRDSMYTIPPPNYTYDPALSKEKLV